jgi:hypothetical protein
VGTKIVWLGAVTVGIALYFITPGVSEPVARLLRGEGSLTMHRKTPASEDAGYSNDQDCEGCQLILSF